MNIKESTKAAIEAWDGKSVHSIRAAAEDFYLAIDGMSEDEWCPLFRTLHMKSKKPQPDQALHEGQYDWICNDGTNYLAFDTDNQNFIVAIFDYRGACHV